jgi:hypothetical protein
MQSTINLKQGKTLLASGSGDYLTNTIGHGRLVGKQAGLALFKRIARPVICDDGFDTGNEDL